MKVAVVTGSEGFVGRHMVKRLDADGWTVWGVDIENGHDCRDWFRHPHLTPDLLIHCAANVGGRAKIDNDPLWIAENLAMDADFFRFVERHKIKHAVYFSSSAAYPVVYQDGLFTDKLSENRISFRHPKEPDAMYGWAKLIGEVTASKMDTPVHIFRPFSGYGSDQGTDYPFGAFLQRAMATRAYNEPFTIWGDGKQVRDWVHIDDIVNCVMAALETPAPTTMNICTGIPTSMLDLAQMMLDELGVAVPVDWDFQPAMPTGVHYRVGSPKWMERTYKPQITIHEGIKLAFRAL